MPLASYFVNKLGQKGYEYEFDYSFSKRSYYDNIKPFKHNILGLKITNLIFKKNIVQNIVCFSMISKYNNLIFKFISDTTTNKFNSNLLRSQIFKKNYRRS